MDPRTRKWTAQATPGGEEGHVSVVVNPDNGVGADVRMEATFDGNPIVSPTFMKRLEDQRRDALVQLETLARMHEQATEDDAREQLKEQLDKQLNWVQTGLPAQQAQRVENLRAHEQGHLDNSAAVAASANRLLRRAGTETERDAIIQDAFTVDTAVDDAYHDTVGTTVSEDPSEATNIEAWGSGTRGATTRDEWSALGR